MSARDPRQSPAEFVSFARREERSLEEERRLGLRPELAAPRCLRIALARYSAGEPPAASFRWLTRAVDERVRFWRWNGGEHQTYADLDVDLEVFGSAALLGRAAELATALRGARFRKAPAPEIVWLVRALLVSFTGGPPPPADPAVKAALEASHPEWASLPALLPALATREKAPAQKALQKYLADWRTVDRSQARIPSTTGDWSIFAAGCVRVLVPLESLPETARALVPSALIRR